MSQTDSDMKIKIFTTGGSIDKGYCGISSDFIVLDTRVADLLKDANIDLEVEIESLLKKDSLEITDEERLMLVDRVKSDPARLIVISHGTDTLPQTGRALVGIPGKVIVLTGAVQPAEFKHSDAPFNLGFAMAAVQTLNPGVYLAMNGKIYDPETVRKNRERGNYESID